MKSRFTFCLLLLFFTYFISTATHIIGGTIAYQVFNKGSDDTTLRMNFTVYKETSGNATNFDNPADIGIYGVNNNEYTFLKRLKVDVENVEEINLELPAACPEILYEKGSYAFDYVLSHSGFEYYTFVYQRCCRTGVISNILDPELTGYPLSINIYPEAFEYNEKAEELDVSTVPFFLNTQNMHEVDLGIDDPYIKDYKLTKAKVAGGIVGNTYGDPTACDGLTPNPIICPPPFDIVIYVDEDNPYGVNSIVNLDNELGLLSAHIPNIGVTLFEMTVDRYMDGELLSSINNQWTTTTSTCIEPVAVNDISSSKEVSLSPNPATNSIHLNTPLTDIEIWDALGKQVMKIEKATQREDISIGLLTPGAYILKGKNENGNLIKLQFIKSRS